MRLDEPLFDDRRQAGHRLAERLEPFKGRHDVVVLGLPRGGVPVAYEVARALGVSFDVFLVRKLGVPGHSELAMGALASGGVRVLNNDVVAWYGIPDSVIQAVARAEQAELDRRERLYRQGRPLVGLRDRIVILVDDGLATGSSMKAAVRAVRAYTPAKVIVAVPVCSPQTQREFDGVADNVICVRAPEKFNAVGQWYRDFAQITDHEVRELLHGATELLARRR
jgi:predicted phosphoribosyltransferase